MAGVALIAVPILFNVGFTSLAQRFDYPDVLRRPTHEVLERFRALLPWTRCERPAADIARPLVEAALHRLHW